MTKSMHWSAGDGRRRWVRQGGPLLVDSAAWLVGLLAAVWTRFELDITASQITSAVAIGGFASAVHAVMGYGGHLYRGRYRFGSFEEARAVFVTVLWTGGLLLAVNLTLPELPLPASGPVTAGVVAVVGMLGARCLWRLAHDRRVRPDTHRATPVLLFGAGSAGRDLVRGMLRDRNSRYLPVGLLDDDPALKYMRVCGVPVIGDRWEIPLAVERTGARSVVFSVANADRQLIRDIRHICLDTGLDFKVVPSLSEVLDGRAAVADVRDVQISDLLGRRQIETDLESVAGYLTGKKVLVTGAGGSIGAELCRQIQRFAPSELMMLDRDESALHAVQLTLCGRALLDSSELILADLRDGETVREIFASRRPQVVFHAAALKHLPLLERHPAEAVKTNVRATLAVVEAACEAERFVNISTDKAANPSSVLGYSKRITERLTAHAAALNDGIFLSVRFGNVLGSRGSVLTAFTAQAAAGGPLTVTHPDVTRYFMTVEEAVQLVIQAAAIGRGGEALILDMGHPVRISEVARHIAEQAPRPLEIVYTGLRPGEKLHEELFGAGERDVRRSHPLISHVAVPPLHPDDLKRLETCHGRNEIVGELARLCRHGVEYPEVPVSALEPVR